MANVPQTARLSQAQKRPMAFVASVHHVEGVGLEDQHVEHLGAVGLAVGEVNKRWDCAPKVQQGVNL